jgi:hypothetical protein
VKIVVGRPPNFDQIAAVLPEARGERTIFCYGDTIYNPGGGKIPRTLRAHEAVHSARQGTTEGEIRAWWTRYLADPQFRFDEELPAHQAEYASFCSGEGDKEKRFRFLVGLAKRLSGPLYGQVVDFFGAKRAIRSIALDAAGLSAA